MELREQAEVEILSEAGYLLVRDEPIIAEVIGAGTSSVILKGSIPAVPSDAVLITPSHLQTSS